RQASSCPCRPLSRLARAGTRRPRSGARPVLHHFHTGARRWPRLAWRTAHWSHGYLVSCARAGARPHGAGWLAPRTGSAVYLPSWLLRRPAGAGGRTLAEVVDMKRLTSALDAIFAGVHPGLIRVTRTAVASTRRMTPFLTRGLESRHHEYRIGRRPLMGH